MSTTYEDFTSDNVNAYILANESDFQTNGTWNNNDSIAAFFNAVSSSYIFGRPSVSPTEINEAIDHTELAAALAAGNTVKFDLLKLLEDEQTLDFTNANTLGGIIDALLPASDFPISIAAINALATRSGSLAENLFGPGKVMDTNTVYNAMYSINGV